MARVREYGTFKFGYVEDPFAWEDRGWIMPGTKEYPVRQRGVPVPSWLFWMCVSGREEPWRNWRGRVPEEALNEIEYRRDEWSLWSVSDVQYDSTASYGREFVPVDPAVRGLSGKVLAAPFPLTLDVNLVAYAACSIGEAQWVPDAPLVNGRCSVAMLRLMNSFPHKPAFIIAGGRLVVWINVLCWSQVEPKVSYYGPQPYTELELFRAYRAYYEQLRRELPHPYAGPVVWPDQCDTRFPLPTDPRAAHYGMWKYSGGLPYGENPARTVMQTHGDR